VRQSQAVGILGELRQALIEFKRSAEEQGDVEVRWFGGVIDGIDQLAERVHGSITQDNTSPPRRLTDDEIDQVAIFRLHEIAAALGGIEGQRVRLESEAALIRVAREERDREAYTDAVPMTVEEPPPFPTIYRDRAAELSAGDGDGDDRKPLTPLGGWPDDIEPF